MSIPNINTVLFLILPLFGFCQNVVPYPDNSPSLNDFILMGVPSESSIWKYADYEKAIKILDQIYEADKFSLPRFKSKFSGKLFKRMVSVQNFEPLTDTKINIGKRVLDFEKLRDIPNRLMIYYIEDDQVEERFSTEVLECYFLDAYVTDLGLKLYDELKIQMGERAKLGQLQTGYKLLQLELNKKIEQLFYLLEEDYHRFDKNDWITFVNKLFFFLPRISNVTYRKQLKTRIKLLERHVIDPKLKEIFQELRQEL